MKKTFTLWAACALPMISSLGANEAAEDLARIQEDRERLIDLVLKLEADFGKTLQDYTKLQQNYSDLLNRSAIPDQSGKVKELQKQLAETAARLKAGKPGQSDQHSRQLLEQDLVNLRNELHKERQDLLVAKARLLRVKQLEAKNKSLEDSLKKETADRAATMGQLQAVRGERDALMVRLKDLMDGLEKSKKGLEQAKIRVAELEKETTVLKLKVRDQDVELRKLRVDQAHTKGAMAAAVDLKTEQDRLSALLATREKELADLREDLATEMKRSLDVPLLIKARDELQEKLEASNTNADGLQKKNKALTERQATLQKEIETVQKSIVGMQAELTSNKESMANLAKLDEQNKLLLEEKEQLENTIQMAKAELVRSRSVLQTTEAKLHESQKMAVRAEELKIQNDDLLNQQEQLKMDFTAAKADVASMQEKLVQNETALKAAMEAGKEMAALKAERDQLGLEMKDAQASFQKIDAELKTAQAKLAKTQEVAARAAELKEQNEEISKKHESLKLNFATAKADLATMQDKMAQTETALKAAAEAGKGMTALKAEYDQISKQMEEARAAYQERDLKLKEAQVLLAKSDQIEATAKKALSEADQLRKTLSSSQAALKEVEVSALTLKTEKEALVKEIAARDADLKKLSAEMAKKPDMSEEVSRLQKEKDKLAADLAKREEDLKKARGDLGRLQLAASVAQKQLIALKHQSAVIDPVRYARGEADVTAQQTRVLSQVQQVLKLFPEARFEIVGHTCDLGSVEGNLLLSQKRAEALQDFLLDNGIKEDRLKCRGVGQAEPAVPNTSEENRRQNRRVVVEILD